MNWKAEMIIFILYLIILLSSGQLNAVEKIEYKQAPSDYKKQDIKAEELAKQEEFAKQAKQAADAKRAEAKRAEDARQAEEKQRAEATKQAPTTAPQAQSSPFVKPQEPEQAVKKEESLFQKAKALQEPKKELEGETTKKDDETDSASKKWYNTGKIGAAKAKAKELKSKYHSELRILKYVGSAGAVCMSLLSLSLKLSPILSGFKKSDGANLAEADTGIVSDSPYPAAKPNDKNFQRKLAIAADEFTGIQEKFKHAIENNNYNDKTFNIAIGAADFVTSAVDVNVEYDFNNGGAGNLEMPFTPFIINFSPEQIDGFAVDLESLILQISNEDDRVFAEKLVYPNAAFVFLIKYMLFNQATFKNVTTKDATQQTIQALSHIPLLLYRYAITQSKSKPSADILIQNAPQAFQDYLEQTKFTMPSDLIQHLNTTGDLQQFIDDRNYDVPAKSVLNSYIQLFLNIQSKKFSGDTGFIQDNTTLEKHETLEQLIAIFIRSLKIIASAEQYLFQTTDSAVTLRTSSGQLTINPNKEFNKIVKPSANKLVQANKNLTSATSKFRKKNISLEKYNSYKTTVASAVEALAKSNMAYRTKITLNYPVKLSNGTDTTVLEFLKKELTDLKNRGNAEIFEILNDIYGLIQQNIGLPLSEIWQDNSAATTSN